MAIEEPVMPTLVLLDVLAVIDGWDPAPGPADKPDKWAKANISKTLRQSVLMKVGKHPGGTEVPYRELAAELGYKSAGTVLAALQELTDRRVLLRRSIGGSAGAYYRVSPWLLEWRAVRWRLDERYLLRVMFPGEVTDITEPVFVPRGARGIGDLVPRDGARHYERPPRLVPRGFARHYDTVMPRGTRGTNADRPKGSGHYGGSAADVLSRSGVEETKKSESDPAMKTTQALIRRHLRLGYFEGEPLAAVAELVAQHGHDAVRDAIPYVAPHRSPMIWVRTLELELIAPTDELEDPPPSPAAPRPVEYHAGDDAVPDATDPLVGVGLARRSLKHALGCDTEPGAPVVVGGTQ